MGRGEPQQEPWGSSSRLSCCRWTQTHSAYAEHFSWEVSWASGSQLVCIDLLRDLPLLLLNHHRTPQQSQQQGLLSVLHPCHPQVGSDAELKEVHCLCLVIAASGIFVIGFIATVIFKVFFLHYENEEIQIYWRVLHFKEGFLGQSGGMILKKCEVCTV